MSEKVIDRDLVKRLKGGDVFSFDEIYEKFSKKIYSFSLSYLKNKEDAEEIVQEVFMNLWRRRAELKEQYNIDSYLFKITFNAVRGHFRKLSRERKHLKNFAKTVKVGEDTTNTDVEYNNLIELTEIAVNKLPPRQKKVYQLSAQQGLTNEEISKKLKISKKTVENHLQRARTFLRNTLEDDKLITLLFIWLFII